MPTPVDPLFTQQWHFPLIGNIQAIWDEFTGAGVSVGVYDQGVQYTHPDLAANYDASLHFVYDGFVYDGMPIFRRAAHGTACAGLVGAVQGNGLGGVGVAWDVSLTSVNYLDVLQNESFAVEMAAINWASHFDIMTNSWGRTPFYDDYQNLADPASHGAQVAAEYAAISASARLGLGTVIVQAAGNDRMNANGEAFNISRHTITVAATESTGFIANYSNFGACILIAAPASAVTTDMLGNSGYNNATDSDLIDPNYTSTFNGTSAATPTVSGVVALMLQAAPFLGWRDIANILAMSASHTGTALGAGHSVDEVSDWITTGGNQWNGGGNGINLSYGYGMVDAYAAVRMAEVWLDMQGNPRTSASELSQTYSAGAVPIAIPDSNGVVDGVAAVSWAVINAMEIESIYVTIDITHSFASDLVVSLIAPDGTTIPLFFKEGVASLFVTGLKWTFAVENLRGYSSLGLWKIEVVDTFAGDVGFINDASLKFFGAAASNRDIYHFTDDFLAYRNLEAGRGLLNDSNGGIDTLNFAAIAGNIVANLAAGQSITVGGIQWVTLSADPNEFERFFAGDGNDSITGNAAINALHGARGNDTLSGGNGNDDLSGGQGSDRLFGGNHTDAIGGGAGTDYLDGGRNNDILIGGADADRFVFARNYAADSILDFTDNVDTIVLSHTLWVGVLNVAQVITTYAANVSGLGVVLTFATDILTINGLADKTLLLDDLVIV